MADKVALVTGGASPIGSAVCRALAAEGWSIALHYHRNKAAAAGLQAALRALGAPCELLRADLTRLSTGRALVRDALGAFGRLDVLVNNAGGVVGTGGFGNITETDWQDTMNLNAGAPLFLSREALKVMERGGRIINVSSVSAKFGGSETTLHYAAAKAALESLTRGLARLAAPRRILINAVQPGLVERPSGPQPGAKRLAYVPLGRQGKPEEVARLVSFLIGPGGDYITGQVLPITGGE